jgi:hypothetical protein
MYNEMRIILLTEAGMSDNDGCGGHGSSAEGESNQPFSPLIFLSTNPFMIYNFCHPCWAGQLRTNLLKSKDNNEV